MPAGDRTGPAGLGPMTERAAGFCAGYNAPGCGNPVGGYGYGRRFGRGYRRGFGWRGFSYAAPTPYSGQPYQANYSQASTAKEEVQYLKEEARGLKNELEVVNQRIKDLELLKKNEH